ncbi:unnamed protein product, partial [Schistosoma haematobium]
PYHWVLSPVTTPPKPVDFTYKCNSKIYQIKLMIMCRHPHKIFSISSPHYWTVIM